MDRRCRGFVTFIIALLFGKMKKSDKKHLAKVSDIGCIVCKNESLGQTPAELHHIRNGYGRAQRAPHTETIPLCPYHHRLGDGGHRYRGQIGYHYNSLAFEKRYGTERELLEQVRRILNEQ